MRRSRIEPFRPHPCRLEEGARGQEQQEFAPRGPSGSAGPPGFGSVRPASADPEFRQPQAHEQTIAPGDVVGEDDLLLALDDGLVNRLNVDAHDGEGRQLPPQFRQCAAQALDVPMRAQDPADHEVAIGGGGDEKMLEFAASCIDVVGADAQSAHGPGENGQGVLDRGHVQGAAAQVDAAVGTENAEDGGGAARRPPSSPCCGSVRVRLPLEAARRRRGRDWVRRRASARRAAVCE